jgi:hypothetical protein
VRGNGGEGLNAVLGIAFDSTCTVPYISYSIPGQEYSKVIHTCCMLEGQMEGTRTEYGVRSTE